MINILIAEDNIELANMIEIYLANSKDFEYNIKRVTNGEECVDELIKSTDSIFNEYDVLLLDLIMPVKDGFYVLDNFGNISFKNKPKVILFTGMDNSYVKLSSNKMVDYVILKPFNFNMLKERINSFAMEKKNEEKVTKQIGKFYVENMEELDREQKKEKLYKENKIDKFVHNLLSESGILPNLKGYRYIYNAIKLCILDSSKLSNVSKGIYCEISVLYNTTPVSVERSIRNSIIKAWEKDRLVGFSNFVKIEVPDKKLFNTLFLSYAVMAYFKQEE